MQDAIFSPPLSAYRPNPKRMQIGVLASGNGSNFEALVEASRGGVLNADMSVVVCNRPGAGVIERANRLGVACVVVNHHDFASREAFDAAVAAELADYGVAWVAMAGWMRVATSALLRPFAGRMLNLHPSLLPAFRGAHAVRDALDAGVKVAGCTVHHVIEALDAGPVVAQAAVGVDVADDHDSLTRKINALEHVLYPRALAWAMSRDD